MRVSPFDVFSSRDAVEHIEEEDGACDVQVEDKGPLPHIAVQRIKGLLK